MILANIGSLYKNLKDNAFIYNPDGIRLSSGLVSDFYFDTKRTFCTRAGGTEFARFALDIIDKNYPNIQSVGGLETGAIVPSSFISALSSGYLEDINCFYVRKESKSHGTQDFIEGVLHQGDSVIIIEDVLTTGSSAVQAIKKVENFGAVVKAVIALLDRETVKNSDLSKYPVYAACTISEFFARYPLDDLKKSFSKKGSK